MAFLKAAVLFALVAISFQNAEGHPGSITIDFQGSTPSVNPAVELPLISQKAEDALRAAVEEGQITVDQYNEVLSIVLRDQLFQKLSGMSAVDIALENLRRDGDIDIRTKVLILLSAIRAGCHKTEYASLKDGVGAALTAALRAGVISDETAKLIKKGCPELVQPDSKATTSERDVHMSVAASPYPLGVRTDIYEIAKQHEDILFNAVDAGRLTRDQANELRSKIWAAAKQNELTNFSKLLVILNNAVKESIIDLDTSREILLHGRMKAVFRKLPEDFPEALARVLDSALEFGIVSPKAVNKLEDIAIRYIKETERKEQPASQELALIAEKAKEALSTAVKEAQLTTLQNEEVYMIVLADKHFNKLSGLSAVDIALEKLRRDGDIDIRTKVLILLSAIRAGCHKTEPASLKDGVAAAVKAALEAGAITEQTAELINRRAPKSVVADSSATTSARDVNVAIAGEPLPLGVRKDVYKVARKVEDVVTAAVKADALSWPEANEILHAVWDAARSNELTNLSKLIFVLDAGVNEKIIDYNTSMSFFLSSRMQQEFKKLPENYLEALVYVLRAATEYRIISSEQADELAELSIKYFPIE